MQKCARGRKQNPRARGVRDVHIITDEAIAVKREVKPLNEKRIWATLLSRIGNPFGTAGLMGNLYAESGLRPNDLEGKYARRFGMTDEEYTSAVDSGSYQDFVHDSAGYGLAQWTYWSRKQALLSFARERGTSIGDLGMQLDFLMDELQAYRSVMETLTTAPTVREASDAVMLRFERPKDTSEAARAKRAAYGQQYFDRYAEEDAQMEQRVISIATNEIGYLEKASTAQLDDKTANAGRLNYTKYARDLDRISWFNGKKQGAAWCAVFVTWCFYKAFGASAREMLFQPTKDNCAAGCGYARSYFNRAGHLHQEPEPGDQIFFFSSDLSSISHTGLVVDVTSTHVYTIEGNTSDGSSVVDNGGAVCRKSYTLGYNRIAGYGRPDWSKAGSPAEEEKDEVSYTAIVHADSGRTVNLRAGMSTSSALVTAVPVGSTVDVYEDLGDWASVAYQSYTGYMMRKFLIKDAADDTVTVPRSELEQVYAAIGRLLGKG